MSDYLLPSFSQYVTSTLNTADFIDITQPAKDAGFTNTPPSGNLSRLAEYRRTNNGQEK